MIGAHERAQRAFAAYVREPLGQPLPEGIEPRRMKIYAERCAGSSPARGTSYKEKGFQR